MIRGDHLQLEKLLECKQGASEVSEVFRLLKEYLAKRKQALNTSLGRTAESLAWVVTLAALAVIACLFIALSFLPETTWGDSEDKIRLTLQLIIFFVYILGAASLCLHFAFVKRLSRNFTDELIGIVEERTTDEVALLSKLDSLSTQSTDYVAKQLERAANDLGSILSFFLGAIE